MLQSIDATEESRNELSFPTTALAPTFRDFPLHPDLQAAVAAMGITTPTPIQEQVIPLLLDGADVIGQARTGSGKTLAYALPIVECCDPQTRGVQALILVPTRELALQVATVIRKLADARHLRLTMLYGGRSYDPEKKALERGVQIVVGTPGRTLDHLRQGTLRLGDLGILVLDESDEMLDQGFAPDVDRILSFAPKERQTALLSATVPAWVHSTAAKHMIDPVMVRADVELETPPEIEHTVYVMDPATKYNALCAILDEQQDAPILVFGRTKHGVKKLADRLIARGYSVDSLQGNLSQNARERVMRGFRNGEVRILVATNVAARGLDISGIGQVINFELPDTAELFTHRAGRTGRMGASGEAITFLTPEDGPKWRQIERALGRTLPRKMWGLAKNRKSVDDGTMPGDDEAAVELSAALLDSYEGVKPRKAWGFTRGKSNFSYRRR